MKTLIINGSPRRKGDTSQLINEVIKDLKGEYKIVNVYEAKISACIDCRYCKTNKGCYLKDEMQALYKEIETANNILIASPIYFSEITGRLLEVGSRLQTYYSARRFRKEVPILEKKKGAVILVGGGEGKLNKAYETASILLRCMNVETILPVVSSHHTDEIAAKEDKIALQGCHHICTFFNENNLDLGLT